MSRSRIGKATLSLILVLLMILPVLAPLAPVTMATDRTKNIYIQPDNIAVVPGQDVIFFVSSDTDAFYAEERMFYQIKDVTGLNYWRTFIGILGYAGDTFGILTSDANGKIENAPLFLDWVTTQNLNPAESPYILRVTDYQDRTREFIEEPFEVVDIGSVPRLYIGDTTYNASQVVNPRTLTLNIPLMAKASPSDPVEIYLEGFPAEASTAAVYFDSFDTPLGSITLEEGQGSGEVTIPEAAMGVHALIAVASAAIGTEVYSFVAINFIYVVPTVVPSTYVIEGVVDEEFTIELHGYPAGFHLDDVNARIISRVVATPYTVYLDIMNEDAVVVGPDGTATITVALESTIPWDRKGPLDLVLPVDGAVPESYFTFPFLMVASTPAIPGDEGVVIAGADYYGDRGEVETTVGSPLKIIAFNFPATSTLTVYVGFKQLPVSIPTDDKGGAVVTLVVPEIPYGTYLFKVVDEATGLMAFKPTPNPSSSPYPWTIKIVPDFAAAPVEETGKIIWEVRGVGVFLDPGVTIRIKITGLKPFENVVICEKEGTTTIARYDDVYADANGVVETSIQTSPDVTPDPTVVVSVMVRSGSILSTYGSSQTIFEYHPTGLSTLTITDMISDAYLHTTPRIWVSVQPGGAFNITVTNLIPGIPYKLYLDDAEADLRDGAGRIVPVLKSKNLADTFEYTVVIPDGTAYGLHKIVLKELLTGSTRSTAYPLIVSDPAATTEPGIDSFTGSYTVVSGPDFGLCIIGWNFVYNEDLTFIFAGQLADLRVTDRNGAFMANLGSPALFGTMELPRGSYVLSVMRGEDAPAPEPLTLEVVPYLYTPSPDSITPVYAFESQSIFATGLDSGAYYYVTWSTSEDEAGEPLTPPVGTTTLGTLDTSITIPAVLPGYYYIHVVPYQNPSEIILTAEVKVLGVAGDGWSASISDVVLIPGQQVTVTISDFSAFLGVTPTELIMLKGKGFVKLETLDGDVARIIPAGLVYDTGSDVMQLTFNVPNDFDTLADQLFKVYAKVVYMDEDLTIYETDFKLVALTQRIASGGLLVGLGAGAADILTTLGKIQVSLEKLNATLVEVSDGVMTLQTSIGEVQGNLTLLRTLLENATVKIDGVMAAIESANATIHAKLDALMSLIGGGQVNLSGIEQGIAEIKTMLGDVKMGVDDLKMLLATVGDNVEILMADIGSVNTTLADLIVKKGDEVVATLKVDLSQLGASIADVKDGVALVNTNLGQFYMNLSNGQAAITGLIQQNGETLVQINNAITAKASQIVDLIENGVRADLSKLSSDMAAGFSNLASTVDKKVSDAKDAILASVSDVRSAVSDVDVKVQTVGADVAKVKDEATAIKSDLSDVKSMLSDVKAKVDELPTKVDQSVSQSTEGVKTDLSTKIDEATGSLKTWGIVNLILILVAVALLGYQLFVRKP